MTIFWPDVKLMFLAFLAIAIATLITQWVSIKHINKQWISRKALHTITIIICAIAVNSIANKQYLSLAFLLFGFVLSFMLYKKWFMFSHSNSLGIPAFAFSFFIILYFPIFNKPIVVAAMLILALSDSLAGLLGKAYGNKIIFLYEEKSFLGFFVFFVTTFLILGSVFGFVAWTTFIIIALCLTLTELFSWRGLDNFTIPILACILLFIHQQQLFYTNQCFLLLIFGLPFGVFIYFKKWLTVPALTAALWLGLITIACLQIKAFLLPFSFLIIGSLLSKLNKKMASQSEKKGRTTIQVFANGLVATLCAIAFGITQQPIFIMAFISSYAISICDTTSSEAGRYFKGKTISILNLKPMPIGLSGGISWQGTFCGLLASVLMGILAFFIFPISMQQCLIIISIGFIGMLMDSFLGAIFQAKYTTSNNQIAEEFSKDAQLVSGYKWCNNNTVNLWSHIITVGLFIIIFSFLN